jgi:hypothetical protein
VLKSARWSFLYDDHEVASPYISIAFIIFEPASRIVSYRPVQSRAVFHIANVKLSNPLARPGKTTRELSQQDHIKLHNAIARSYMEDLPIDEHHVQDMSSMSGRPIRL